MSSLLVRLGVWRSGQGYIRGSRGEFRGCCAGTVVELRCDRDGNGLAGWLAMAYGRTELGWVRAGGACAREGRAAPRTGSGSHARLCFLFLFTFDFEHCAFIFVVKNESFWKLPARDLGLHEGDIQGVISLGFTAGDFIFAPFFSPVSGLLSV